MDIIFENRNSFIYITVCLIVAATITGIVYYRNRENNSLQKWQHRLLLALRFSSFFLIAVLLLSPLVKSIKRFIDYPKIIVAFDNSSSLVSLNSSDEQIKNLSQKITSGLENDFEIINYTFGEKTKTNKNITLQERKSDYSNLINTTYNNHFNENIGALILVGDGIYNMGANPLNSAQKLNFPVYTIGLGDTSLVTDSKISDIRVNRTVFNGNKFPVEIDLEFSKCPKLPALLQIYIGTGKVYNQYITPEGDDYFTTVKVILEAKSPGIQNFSIKLDPITDERNIHNNKSQFVIDVLENKQKILILSESPHPDLGAIKNILEQQQNYEVTLITKEPFPNDLKIYNLVILNQLPSSQNAINDIITLSEENKIPLLLFSGGNTFLPQLNQLNLGIEVLPQAGSNEEATPAFSKNFELFKLTESVLEIANKFPPLLVPFAKYNLDPQYKILFFQTIKNIETNRPLIAAGNLEGRKIGFVFGEGIWRWRLYNYYFNESHSQFNELFNSLIQYLALRENDDNFIINYETVYNETDPIIFNAEVYNELFQPFNEPEINIEIKDTTGNNFQFTFDKSGNFYRLDAGNWPVGNYTFSAKVTIGETEYLEKGSFAVVPVNIEMLETRANHQLLYQLATTTGGHFYRSEEIEKLINDINLSSTIKPEINIQSSLNDLLNMKWVFFVILLTFSLEWFLRKYWGIY